MSSLTRRDVVRTATVLPFLSGATSAFAGSAAVKIRRGYADCRIGQIHVLSGQPADGWGHDKTPLVCLHQSPASGDFYREFLAVMAQDRVVLCPDTPGFGGSDKPAQKPTMADYGAAMAEAMESLGYGAAKPLDWLGFHTGNFIITEVAAQRPDLIRRVVMPAIPYFSAAGREERRKQYAGPRPYFTDPDYVGTSFRDTVLNADSPLSKERLMELFTERLRAGLESWWAFDAVFRYDPEDGLAHIKHDVLLPIMLKETLAEPTRQAVRFLKNAKSVEIVELPGLSGLSWMTEPAAIADAIRPFLDKA